MVPLCGGLPLALQVLGRIFADKEKRKPEEWRAIESQWATFRDRDDAYTSQVTEVLDLSYKNLKASRREAFLDVASCFYGWPWAMVESIVGKESLRDLRDSSLIWQVHDIDHCNQSALSDGWYHDFSQYRIYETFVSMHDLTLLFAKSHPSERGEYVKRPLTSLEDLPKPTSLKNLILSIGDKDYSQQLVSYIQEASGLQTLIVKMEFRGPSTIKYRSAAAIGGRQESLRFLDLRWRFYGRKKISFLMKKEVLRDIVYLSLENCGIEEIGEFSMPCLQVLKVSFFSGLIGDVGKLRSLKVLYLSSCERLMKLAESMGGMECLVYLSVDRCKNLVEIPEDIGKLRCLKVLNLCSNESLQKLPESMFGMENLEILELLDLENPVDLQVDIGKLRSLKRLDLSLCRSLQKLPESICGSENLESLNLWSCEKLVDLPGDIGKLRCLKILALSGCERLQKLPESLGGMESLEYLNVAGCNSLVKLPAGLGKMRCLRRLELSNCKMLEKYEGSMEFLEILEVRKCCNGGELSGGVLEKLPSLKRLILSKCDSVTELPADEVVSRLESLEALEVEECENVRELPEAVGKLRSLKTLDLSFCTNLKKLPESVGSMESLETLTLKYCNALEELPEQLANLTSLRALDISGCYNLRKLPVLSTSVRILHP